MLKAGRYILQLRYGCTSPECVTPHCFSGKKRFARTPVRRPNPYTARLQAYALATRSDPYAALCPHPPTVQAREILPTDGEEALNLYVDAKERQNGLEWDGQKQATYEPAGTLYRRRATGTKGSGPFLCYEVFQRAGSSGDETDESPKVDLKSIPVLSTWSAFHVSLHDKKDFKSLTQCLFDTFALKRFEKSNVQSVRRHNVYAHQSGEQFTIRRCSNRSYTSNPDDALSLIEEIGPGIHDLETGEPDTFGASSEFFHCGTPGSLEYLFNILGPLFTPPPSKLASDSADTATSSQSNDDTYVSDEKAFSTIMQCLLILPNCTFGGRNYTLRRTKWANISTNGTDLECYKEDHHHDFGSELVLRLVDRLVRAIAARRCHFEMMNTLHSSQTATDSWSQISRFPLADRLIKSLPVMEKSYFKLDADPDPSWSFTGLVTDFLEALMLHKWNSDTVVNRWTALGGAMELLNEMCKVTIAS